MGKSTRTCSFGECNKPHMAKGLCVGHWGQQYRGQGLRPLRSQITVEQRFWPKVDKSAPGGCWEWTGAATDGYGQISVDNRMAPAHRISWEFVNAPIPEGMMLDHRCANRKCVNPAHLRVVTNAKNMQHRTGANRDSVSGIRGVSWDKVKNSWKVQVRLNGRDYWGGRYPTLEEAAGAVKDLRARLHTHDDYDEWLNRTA